MGGFRALKEDELAGLDDSRLIEYALAARDAGESAAELLALQIFAFGMQDRVLGLVRSQLGSHGDPVIEEVAARALEDAIRSIERLRGHSAGEARSFVFTIARKRVIDYHRKGRVDSAPLEIDLGSGEVLRPDIDGRHLDGEADAVELSIMVREALATLREDHRLVVELNVLRGCSAAEAAEEVNGRFDGRIDDLMSEDNVHKIASRFRKDLRRRIEGTSG